MTGLEWGRFAPTLFKELNAISKLGDEDLDILLGIANAEDDKERRKFLDRHSDSKSENKNFAKRVWQIYGLISKELYESYK